MIAPGQDLEALVVSRLQLAEIPWDPMSCEWGMTGAFQECTVQMGAMHSEPLVMVDHCLEVPHRAFDPMPVEVEACVTEWPPPSSSSDDDVAQPCSPSSTLPKITTYAAHADVLDGSPAKSLEASRPCPG